MSERVLYPPEGPDYRGRTLSGNFTIGAAAAVTAQSAGALSGAVVTKVAATTGRYLVTPFKTFKTFKSGKAVVEGPPSAPSGGPTTGESGAPMLRACTGTSFIIQMRRNDTLADADATSGTKVHWSAELSETA